MSHQVTVAVEGPGADRALAELLRIDGIHGEVQPADRREVTRSGDVLEAIGTIVGIVGGIAPVASSIVKWWKSKRANENDRFRVVIEDTKGNRISLDQATPEQISAILQTLQG